MQHSTHFNSWMRDFEETRSVDDAMSVNSDNSTNSDSKLDSIEIIDDDDNCDLINFWDTSVQNENKEKFIDKKITTYIDSPSERFLLNCVELKNIPKQIIDFSTLLHLELSRNYIERIDILPQNIKELVLAKNNISFINKDCIPASLLNINLNNNQITELDFIIPTIKVLSINENKISSINSSHILNINSLYIEDNNITDLDLKESKELIILNISENPLLNIDNLPPQLHELEMRLNKVSIINYLPESLTKLVANRGQITQLNIEKLPNNMNTLDLYDNKLEKCLPLHTNLKEVDLMDNNLKEMVYFHDNMDVLDLRNNINLVFEDELIQRFKKINSNNNIILYDTNDDDDDSVFHDPSKWLEQLQQKSLQSGNLLQSSTLSQRHYRIQIPLQNTYSV